MLRALVNFVGSVGGGILGGAAGTIGGPLGSFAGGFAGSTLGATVTDSIYSSIAGSDGTNPAEVSYAPVNPATSVPMGATPPTASLRKNLEEDPLKRLKEEYR
jgi:phage tail tape-measure protein